MATAVDEDLLLCQQNTAVPEATTAGGLFLSAAKWVLKIGMWAVLVVWVALFFISYTQFGDNLLADYLQATSGSCFGSTGAVYLFYNWPIMLIAFLAVPYLFLSGGERDKKRIQGRERTPRIRLGTFPILTDGAFGVVSAAEMIGILLFAVFVVWAAGVTAIVNYNEIKSATTEVLLIMAYRTAKNFGVIALSCISFLFLPIARGSVLLQLINIPFEQATRYHVWLGNLIMVLLTLHGFTYIIVWTTTGVLLQDILEWRSDTVPNLAGVISYVSGVAMWVTTIPMVRRRYSFEVFYYTHHLYVLFIVFMAFHVGVAAFSEVATGILLFMLDRFIRFCQSRTTVWVSSVTCFPCGTLKLVLPKPPNLEYTALSFVFLHVKGVSRLQWHPFSVSSSPLDSDRHFSVLIKAVGGWTEALRQNLLTNTMITAASVEGPYGPEFPYHLTYENLVLVAGGSGISPFIAILSDILHRIRENRPCKPRNVLLIWAFRKTSELLLLRSAGLESICSNFREELKLEMQAYVTRESVAPNIREKSSSSNHSAISSWAQASRRTTTSTLVGTGNKIWSAAYLIVSTIGFLTFLGMMDVLYINPLNVTTWWYNSLLFMICMVAGVLIFGGLVLALWHIWETRFSVSTHSQGPSLESDRSLMPILPDDFLIDDDISTISAIHYGYRPNFREIFGGVAETWGHVDVGVIVCGPEGLQVSVARECRRQNSRGITIKGGQNGPIFHFHSHSFHL